MRSTLLASLLVAAACTGSGTVRYNAEVTTPELVEVEPGVQVIADYDEPVFYSDNYYWRYNAGIWYRSNDYRRDWVRVERPSERVSRISRPEVYVHYRANVRADVRDHRDRDNNRRDDRYVQPAPQPQPSGPVVREHGDRTYQPPPPQPQWQPPQQQPQPMPPQTGNGAPRPDERRETREERKDERRDMRDERKDERKDERRDDKERRKDEKEERKDDRKRGR